MAYRNGVYVVFGGNGESNPRKSDLQYFELLKTWNENSNIDFHFSDSYSKTYQMGDDSQREALERSLRERMSNSKSMLIIVSDDMSCDSSLLNEEIKWAVEDYHLPLIVAYPHYKTITNPASLRNKWPKSLEKYIDGGYSVFHVAFKEGPVLEAINTYKVDGSCPNGPMDCFAYTDYLRWGCLNDE